MLICSTPQQQQVHNEQCQNKAPDIGRMNGLATTASPKRFLSDTACSSRFDDVTIKKRIPNCVVKNVRHFAMSFMAGISQYIHKVV